MKITLISENIHSELTQIQKQYPYLTFDNKGYEYLNKSKFTDGDKDAFERITKILKTHIDGFQEFNHFVLDKVGNVGVRFQYNYNYDTGGRAFIGVGYLLLDTLTNGFLKSN